MNGQKKLLWLWIWLLLMAALCPVAQYAEKKRGGFFKGRGKGNDNKESPSQSGGLPKPGLKWAGAAAAGVLGGTGTGLGFLLGRPKHASGGHHGYGHRTASSERDQHHYYNERQGFHNKSHWRAFRNAAAPPPITNTFLALGHLVCFLVAAWINI